MYYICDYREIPRIKRVRIEYFNEDEDIEVEDVWIKDTVSYKAAMKNVIRTINKILDSKFEIRKYNGKEYLVQNDVKLNELESGWECEHNLCSNLIALAKHVEDEIIQFELI